MEKDYMNFNGKRYPIKYVDVDGFSEMVATRELEEDLMDEKGLYVNDQAQDIDEVIFCYVEEKEFNSDETLEQYVNDVCVH